MQWSAFLRRSPLRGRAQHQTYDTAMTRDPVPSSAREGSLLTLAVLALVAGAAAGLVGAVFRLTLAQADQLRIILISWAHGQAAVGFLILVGGIGGELPLFSLPGNLSDWDSVLRKLL